MKELTVASVRSLQIAFPSSAHTTVNSFPSANSSGLCVNSLVVQITNLRIWAEDLERYLVRVCWDPGLGQVMDFKLIHSIGLADSSPLF